MTAHNKIVKMKIIKIIKLKTDYYFFNINKTVSK